MKGIILKVGIMRSGKTRYTRKYYGVWEQGWGLRMSRYGYRLRVMWASLDLHGMIGFIWAPSIGVVVTENWAGVDQQMSQGC